MVNKGSSDREYICREANILEMLREELLEARATWQEAEAKGQNGRVDQHLDPSQGNDVEARRREKRAREFAELDRFYAKRLKGTSKPPTTSPRCFGLCWIERAACHPCIVFRTYCCKYEVSLMIAHHGQRSIVRFEGFSVLWQSVDRVVDPTYSCR